MNDIDSLLDSIFSNGKFNIDGAKNAATDTAPTKSPAQNAKDALDKVEAANMDLSEMLERQVRDMDKINKSMQNEILGMQKELEADGLVDLSKPIEETQQATTNAAENPADAFEGLQKELNSHILGQESFVAQLSVAFKRPFIMGAESDMPKNSILICGKHGTGRHSAVQRITTILHERKAVKNGEMKVVDLSLYPSQNQAKLFLQDLYVALNGGFSVLAFDNYQGCHPAFLAQLSELVRTGKIQLAQRYVLQKGILVEVGTALTPNTVSCLEANGKYLIFFSEHGKTKVAGSFGAAFINALGDICETGNFDEQTLTDISKNLLAALCERSEARLGYTLEYTSRVPQFIREQYDVETGVEGMQAFTAICYKALSEYRLQQDSSKPMTIKLSISDKTLMADFGSGAVSLKSLLPSGYTGDLANVKAQLADIVGLAEIKDYILSLEQNFKVQAMRKAQGLKTASPSMHMIFTGNPGTGKTTIARIVSQYLKAIGVLSGGQLVEVSRADLVGKYVGHTAPLTNSVIQSALGGVLFIDEAYSLFRGKDDSFGMEAIDTLVKGMEDNRDSLVVVLAGYSNEMAEFLTANSGLKSRFPNIIEFPDYSADELLAIAKITCKSKGYRLDEECDIPLLAFFDTVQKTDAQKAGNGRLVRNKVEEAILAQSRRVVDEKQPVLDLLIKDDFDLEKFN